MGLWLLDGRLTPSGAKPRFPNPAPPPLLTPSCPACPRFLHPLQNFAIVSYETKDLPPEAAGKIMAVSVLPTPMLRRGDAVRLVGLTKHLRIMQRKSIVTNATAALTIPSADVPRFRKVQHSCLPHGLASAVSVPRVQWRHINNSILTAFPVCLFMLLHSLLPGGLILIVFLRLTKLGTAG